MNNDNLNQYLSSKKSEGRFFDTSTFTLDVLKARKKMSQFQLAELADSGLWLVKLVQAAVASEAPEIRITLGRRNVKVVFQNTESLVADQLLEMVLGAELSREPLLFHLVTGLRASAAVVTDSVSWSCGGAKVSLNNDKTVVEEIKLSPNLEIRVKRAPRTRSLSKILTTPLRLLIKQTLREYDAVYSRCWVSPIPVYLDGRELKRGYFRRNGDQLNPDNYKNPPDRILDIDRCVGVKPVYSEKRENSNLHYPLLPLEEQHRGVSGRCAPEPGNVTAVLSMFTKYARENVIYIVLHGAVVELKTTRNYENITSKILSWFEPRSNLFHLRLFIGVSPEDLDLSHFQCRELTLLPSFWIEVQNSYLEIVDKALSRDPKRVHRRELSRIKRSLEF